MSLAGTIAALAGRTRACACRLARQAGRRGASLLFLGLLAVLVAASLVNPPPDTRANMSYQVIASLAPLEWWAAAWGAVGVLCIVQAFMRSDRIAFAFAAALIMGWSAMFALSWLHHDAPRGWVSAVIWLAFGVWVLLISTWPESPDMSPRG